MKKGIVYYTHNECDEHILNACRRQIGRCLGGIWDLVSVSLQPLDWGRNFTMELESSDLTMFRQQLLGLQLIDADIVFFCEHDVLYHPSHFDFTPPKDTYCFNLNVWAVDAGIGQAMHYDGMRMTSGLVAYHDILVEHYSKKVEWVRTRGKMSRREIGYEPGKRVSRERLGDYERWHYKSSCPNIDIKHDQNITRKRFDLKEHNNRKTIEDSWILADEVPYWGKTKGRFEDFINDI